MFTAFLTAEGWDPNNRESVALLTEAVQCETMAYMARSKAKGKGKPVKGAHSYRPRPSTLSVEPSQPVRCAAGVVTGQETKSARAPWEHVPRSASTAPGLLPLSPQLTAYLTWVYRHFVMPPAGAGTATLRERPLSVEEIDLDRARSEALLSKKPKSKLSMLRQQDEPCAGGCPAHAISRAGSNSYVVKTTCMLCGHRTSEPKGNP